MTLRRRSRFVGILLGAALTLAPAAFAQGSQSVGVLATAPGAARS